MKPSELKNESLESLLAIYEQAALGWLKAWRDHPYDPDPANQLHDVLAEVYRELRARGHEAQRSLLRLLSHPSPEVQVWAAAHGLEFAPDEAEPVLIKLARSGGALGFDAQMTLREWRKGALRFP